MKTGMALRFGTAGYPLSAKGRSAGAAVETVRRLGLDAMELEFVRGVRYNETRAEQARETARALDVALTAHGPYYINLNAASEEQRAGGREMVLETARAARAYGAKSVTFHAGATMNGDPHAAFRRIRRELETVLKELRKEENAVQIRPELTGKAAQFGTLEDLISLSRAIPGVFPCIDIAHFHARTRGRMNTFKEFCEMLEELKRELGKQALSDLHMHVSGIEYTEKGERRHLLLEESDFNYKAFLRALKEFNAQGVVICESPNLEGDALLLKRTYYSQ